VRQVISPFLFLLFQLCDAATVILTNRFNPLVTEAYPSAVLT